MSSSCVIASTTFYISGSFHFSQSYVCKVVQTSLQTWSHLIGQTSGFLRKSYLVKLGIF